MVLHSWTNWLHFATLWLISNGSIIADIEELRRDWTVINYPRASIHLKKEKGTCRLWTQLSRRIMLPPRRTGRKRFSANVIPRRRRCQVVEAGNSFCWKHLQVADSKPWHNPKFAACKYCTCANRSWNMSLHRRPTTDQRRLWFHMDHHHRRRPAKLTGVSSIGRRVLGVWYFLCC